jgi:hypothetical protein
MEFMLPIVGISWAKIFIRVLSWSGGDKERREENDKFTLSNIEFPSCWNWRKKLAADLSQNSYLQMQIEKAQFCNIDV